MDPKDFIAEFGHIANAPGGVARLRELILQLAISGRLTNREPTNASVAELLAVASKQRASYEAIHGISSVRPLAPIEHGPYPIPDHWVWTRLEQISLYIQRGKSPIYADRGQSRAVSQKCVQWGGFDIGPSRSIADTSLTSYGNERFLREGDLLWNSTGTGTVGRVAIYAEKFQTVAVADSHVTVIRPPDALLSRYLWCVIASPWVQSRMLPSHADSLVSGTTQQVELAAKKVRALPVPLPPTEEQSRIVAKVDELMALCDKLEAQQQARGQLQTALRKSTLKALAATASPAELQTAWTRLSETFPSLFSVPADVGLLRDVILDLGLRGMYLQSEDRAGAIGLADNGKLSLPSGWEWRTLAELSDHITSGSRGWKQYAAASGDRFVRSQDIKGDVLAFESPSFVELPKNVEGMRTLVRPGDLLLTITGANVGKCALAPELFGNAYVSQHVALVRLRDKSLSEFAHLWMVNVFGGRGFLSQYIYGDKPGLNLAQVGSVPIPVPPQKVRSQILNSLRSYQILCDQFQMLLRSKLAVASALATAFVSDLTGIGIESVEEPVKAPKTELLAPLHLGKSPSVEVHAPLATILAHTQGNLNAKDLWQRYGGEVDAFYAQLKTEVVNGWIREPEPALMNEIHDDVVSV